MCMSSGRLAWLVVLALAAPARSEGPGLGVPVDPGTLESLDYTVLPDGDGLPPGSGDAVAGRAVYRAQCLACHGENAAGGVNEKLVGGHGTIDGPQPDKTVGSYWPYATTIFDYVRRAMPYTAPGTLSADEVYALTAYLLYLNDIIDEHDTMDRETLPAVEMPNRDNFVWAWPPESRDARGDGAN